MILGIDGCKEGWVGMQLGRSGSACMHFAATLDGFFDMLGVPEVAGIDMPLHLLDAPERSADRAVREYLRAARGRSVFPALPGFSITPDWMAFGHDEINAECRRRYGCGISRQSFALRGKIAEINRAHAAGVPVIEVHPELSFSLMNDGVPLAYAKRSWGGQRERLDLLRRKGIRIPTNLPAHVMRLAADDIIDAAAAAWTAGRYIRGEAIAFPAPGEGPIIWG